MKRTILSLSALTVALVLIIGCGGEPADEFREAVPSQGELAMTVPASAVNSQTGKLTQALLGQRADLYNLTYQVSHEVNGSIWVGLNVIDTIVQTPPNSITNGVATWGPHTPALEPLTWMLKVSRTGPGQYAYALSARKKATPNGAFSVILAGSSTRGYSKFFSGYKGVYTANATALNALDPIRYPDVGKMVATYDTTGVRRVVKMALKDHSENGGPMADALYTYIDRVDASGHFAFAAKTDLQKNGSLDETFAVESAWNAAGAGRGEAAVKGGDLPSGTLVRISECWDASFARVFYHDNGSVNPDEGLKSACAL